MNKEEYLLTCLAEECSEVIQRICKAQRFGIEEIQKSDSYETRNNRQRIAYELNDLKAIAKLLGELHPDYKECEGSSLSQIQKVMKLEKYMKYSKELGILC